MAYDCIPLPLWFQSIENQEGGNQTSRKICHHFLDNEDSVKEKDFLDDYDKCVEEQKCDHRVPCRSWLFDKTIQFSAQGELGKKGKDTMKIQISISIPPVIDVVEQYNAVTFEAIIGSVGGIVGVWCGLSVTGAMDMLSAAYAKVVGIGTRNGGGKVDDEEDDGRRSGKI